MDSIITFYSQGGGAYLKTTYMQELELKLQGGVFNMGFYGIIIKELTNILLADNT